MQLETAVQRFRLHVRNLAESQDGFPHREWFVRHHLDIVEQIAVELLDCYPQADADRAQDLDLRAAPIEVQILSSADGCAHMVGPFYSLWWYENSHKPHQELMADNRAKLAKDWHHKITLTEARAAFATRKHAIEQLIADQRPPRFLTEADA